jgi:hypothetical protein
MIRNSNHNADEEIEYDAAEVDGGEQANNRKGGRKGAC